MKKIFQFKLLLIFLVVLTSCQKENLALGELSSLINIDRLRILYKGEDLVLTSDKLSGAKKIAGTVISNPSGNNVPEGTVVIQSQRGGKTRGISLSLGLAAASYVVGDSVHVTVDKATLKRVNGNLQVTNISGQDIEIISSARPVDIRSVSVVNILNKPEEYESTLVTIFGNNFNPEAGVEKMEGDKIFNDGTGDMQLHVNSGSALASKLLPYTGTTTGIIIKFTNNFYQTWPQKEDDFIATSIVVDPNIPLNKFPILISGYLADPNGGDTDYEYVQMMATQDIDFNITPFSVITCVNASASTPTGPPVLGWVTGQLRTYKFNITKGTVAKGTFFYVGGYKKIWGASSNDISAANWVSNSIYSTEPGADGVGSPFGTAAILANSGNASGIAVFLGTDVNPNSIPLDVIFYGGNGSVYSAGPPAVGFRVADNDLYDTKGGTQPFWNMNTTSINNNKFAFAIPVSAFSKLGGVFNVTTQAWITPRALTSVIIGNSSGLTDLEIGTGTSQLTE